MSEHVIKSHNKTLLLYHAVCPAKYRRKVFSEAVEKTLKEVCLEIIGESYEIKFVEIGIDEDHVHFLVQSVPMMMPKSIVQIIKSISGREIFKRHKEVKQMLWGGQFWTSGYYMGSFSIELNQLVLNIQVAYCNLLACFRLSFARLCSSKPIINKSCANVIFNHLIA